MNYEEVKDVSGFLVDDVLKLKIEVEHDIATRIRINTNASNLKDILSN